MANLIPQKQVREVNDFQTNITFRQDIDVTGSALVGGDLSVGGSATIDENLIVSGTLFASQSFQLGSDKNERSLISGSVELTGSLTIDGSLSFANADSRLDATASYAIEAINSLLFDGFTSQDFQAQRPTLYVSSTSGNDNNDGRSLQYPLRKPPRLRKRDMMVDMVLILVQYSMDM